MLTFESPFYEFNGVVIFSDHASATTFHYLAGRSRSSRATRTGKPNLLLLKYRQRARLDKRDRHRARAARRRLPDVRGRLRAPRRGATRRQAGAGVAGAARLGSRRPGAGASYEGDGQRDRARTAQKLRSAETETPSKDSKFIRGIVGTATPSLLHNQEARSSRSRCRGRGDAARGSVPVGAVADRRDVRAGVHGLRPALSVECEGGHKTRLRGAQARGPLGIGTGRPPAGRATLRGRPRPAAGTFTPAVTNRGTGYTSAPAVALTGGGGTGATATATSTRAGVDISLAFARAPATPPPPPGHTGGGGTRATATAAFTPAAAPAAGTTPAAEPPLRAARRCASAPTSATPMESLKQSGAITIEIMRQQEGAVRRRDGAERAHPPEGDPARRVLQAGDDQPARGGRRRAAAACQPTRAATTAGTSSGAAGRGDPRGARVPAADEEGGRAQGGHLRLQRDRAGEEDACARTGSSPPCSPAPKRASHIREISLDDPFFKTLDVKVSTTADFAAFDLQNVSVELQYGGTVASPRQTGTAQFTPAATHPSTSRPTGARTTSPTATG